MEVHAAGAHVSRDRDINEILGDVRRRHTTASDAAITDNIAEREVPLARGRVSFRSDSHK